MTPKVSKCVPEGYTYKEMLPTGNIYIVIHNFIHICG